MSETALDTSEHFHSPQVPSERVPTPLPSVGRIVHVNIGVEEPVWRPALVIEAAPDGRIIGQLFVHYGDIPLRREARAHLGPTGYLGEFWPGEHTGEWRWPPHQA